MAQMIPERESRRRYSPLPYVRSEAERVTAYRRQQAALGDLDALLAARRYDAAVTFALPFLARIEGIHVPGTFADALDVKDEMDAREDVSLAQFRQRKISRVAYRAHLLTEIQHGLSLYLRLGRDAE